MSHIYVFCPYGAITGGPDALHQLVFYLNSIEANSASIVYYFQTGTTQNSPFFIPDQYERYVNHFCVVQDVRDDPTNSIIVPEMATKYLFKFPLCKKFIWWLSVQFGSETSAKKKADAFGRLFRSPLQHVKKFCAGGYFQGRGNFRGIISNLNEEPFSFEKEEAPDITHLCASYYAFDFVSRRTRNKAEILIEPISKFFLEQGEYLSGVNRESVVLFNPKKGFDFTKKIIKRSKGIEFVALQGLDWQGLIEKYRTSRLYIDFGPFPGAERMPKEAVFNGCAIITGKNGAASFHQDVPIPEEDKFETKVENIPRITARMRFLLDNYETEIGAYSEYRERVMQLEKEFLKALTRIFF